MRSMNTKSRALRAGLGAFLLVLCTLLVCLGDLERQVSVYAPQKNYQVEVQERQGQLYFSLLDLLQPLGSASIHANGNEWKLQFNNADAVFTEGSDKAKVRGRTIDLGGKTLSENGRVLVPLNASFALLSALLKTPVEVHPSARRIFIDNAGTRFTAELKKGERSSLLLSFDHPVSPQVTHDGNIVRLTFKREPVLSDITNQPLDDKSIHSLSFSEENGMASLTISGASALDASLGSDGRSITIQSPAPLVATAPSQPNPQPASPPAVENPQNAAPATTNEPRSSPAFLVMIDPAHGGDDSGARFSDSLTEKEITLALARRVKAELQERGIAARLLRDGDTTLGLEQRAEIVNQQHTAVYIALHAGTPGRGVRVYAPVLTSSATPAGGKFLPWDAAQAPALPRSKELAREIADQLEKKSLPVFSLGTPLRPLNNVNAPAIAVELATDLDHAQELMNQKFQTTVAAGIASAIVQHRAEMERP